MPITTTVATTSSIWVVKLCGYATAILIFEYLNIKDTQICILWMLMIIDFIVWIWKQLRIDWSKVTSHAAWQWAVKKISTLILILSLALMFKWIEIDWSFYIKSVLAIFIMAETYSITQNVYAIRTKKVVSEYDVVSLIIKKIWDFILETIEWWLKKT